MRAIKIIFFVMWFTFNFSYNLSANNLENPPGLGIMGNDEYYNILPHSEIITFIIDSEDFNDINTKNNKNYTLDRNNVIKLRKQILEICDVGEQCRINCTARRNNIISIQKVEVSCDVTLTENNKNGFGIFNFNLGDTYEDILENANKMGFCVSHNSFNELMRLYKHHFPNSAIEKGAWPSLSIFNTLPPFFKTFEKDNFKIQRLIKDNPNDFPFVEIWGDAEGIIDGPIKLNFYFFKSPKSNEFKMYSFIGEFLPTQELKLLPILDEKYKLIYDFDDDFFLRKLGGFYFWEYHNNYIVLIEKMGVLFYSPEIINEIENHY